MKKILEGLKMPKTKAQTLAQKKYLESRDRISIDVPKGTRDTYNQSAAELKLSLAKMIQYAVEEYIRNRAGENVPDKPQQKSLSLADEKLLAEFSKLPVDAQKSLMQFLRTLNQKGGVQND